MSAHAGPAPVPYRAELLAEAIRERAQEFDVPAAVDLLREYFPGRPVQFRSHPSHGPEPTVVRDIEVLDDRIIVTVNLGLRAGTSPLPSYFQALLADPACGEALAELIERLDGELLAARLATYRVDAGPLFPGDLARVRRQLLTLSQPASPTTLHWLFSTVFPELAVRVERSSLALVMPADEVCLGFGALGVATLGGQAVLPVGGLDVVLRTVESRTWSDGAWSQEGRRRVAEHVLPALAGTGAFLRVVLVDTQAASRLALSAETYLGYDPLVGDAAPRVNILFEGHVPATDVMTETSFVANFDYMNSLVPR